MTHEPTESRVDRAAWSPDGKRILYQAAYQNYDAELYTLVGGRVQAITHNKVDDTDPAWSPDGTAIAFSRSDPVAGSRIIVASVSGKPARALTSGRGFDYSPSWSPDGSRIVFGSAFDDFEKSLIYVMRADGSGLRKLGAGFDPAWSPNGRLIAFVREGEIWVMRSDGSHRRVLVTIDTANSALDGLGIEWLSAPAWSPDGKSIGFGAYYDLFEHGGDFFAALTSRADGTHPEDRLDELDSPPTVEWSPDGRNLLFGAGDVYTASVKSGRPVQRTRLTGWSGHATWQPRCAVYGSANGDALRASRRGDVACGLGGNDTITGGPGRDRLFGEGGDDRLDARDGEFDVIGCGTGSDTVFADARDLVGADCEHVVH